MASSAETKLLKVRCHCKAHEYSFPIPVSALPLSASHCHCNICRHATGALFATYASLPASVPPPYTTNSPPPPTIRSFQSSANCRRLFCSKCGSNLFFNYKPDDPSKRETWSIATGALEKPIDGLLQYNHHMFVDVAAREDSVDFINILHEKETFPGDDEAGDPPLSDAEISELLEIARPAGVQPSSSSHSSARMKFSCHCGGVRGLLSRPSAHPTNKWLSSFSFPETDRWMGSMDLCESCRLSVGCPVLAFIFPSFEHLEFLPSSSPAASQNDSAKDWKARAGLSWWRSSHDVERSFCATCGASVLYEVDDRQGMCDLYVALLETKSEDGNRLSDWVQWIAKMSHAEDIDEYDLELGEKLKEGFANYFKKQSHGTAKSG